MKSRAGYLLLVAIGLVTPAAGGCSNVQTVPIPAITPVALPPAPPVLLVSHPEDGLISIIDTTRREVTGTVNVGAKIGSLALSPDGARAFTSLPDGIAIINLRGRTVERRLPWSSECFSLVPDGERLFVIDCNLNDGKGNYYGKVSLLDLGTGKVTAARSIRNLAGDAVLSADRQRLFVPHHFYSGFVTSLRTGDLGLTGETKYEDGAADIALSPDDRWLYVPNGMTSSGRISVLDAATGKIDGDITLTSEPSGFAMAPDGKRAFVTLFTEASIAVIDLAARKVERTIPAPEHPIGIALSPDGSTAFVLPNGDYPMSVIDVSSGAAQLKPLAAHAIEIVAPARVSGS